MKKLVKSLFVIALTVLFFGSTFSQVNADYDKSVEFSKYKTFKFAGWQKDSEKLVNDIDKQRLYDAFKTEFANRGLEIVTSDADAMLTLYLVVDDKTSVSAYTNYTGGIGYGGGIGWGMGVGGVGMGTSTTTYNEDDYQVGTLVVDVYDASTKKMIWQGSSQQTIHENAAKREKIIQKKVAKLMSKYPADPVK